MNKTRQAERQVRFDEDVRSGVSKRFWRRVRKSPGGCWNWMSNGKSYGQLVVKFKGMYTWLRVHRVSYILHNEMLPEGLQVLHKCDNPRCVNPSHLFIGNQQTNLQDMSEKGRRYSILTEEDVFQIRFLSGGKKRRELAEQFGVSEVSITNIRMGNTWKHML